MLCRRLWKDRSFTDARVVAGSAGGERTIYVHRAVLASKSDFFKTLFEGSFHDSLEAVVRLPEDPDIVDGLLQHIYTGELGEVDVVQLLPLAHRLGLNDCVVDCATAMHSLDEHRLPLALTVLNLLKGHPAVDLAWAKIMASINSDKRLTASIIDGLASLACQKLPSPGAYEHLVPGLANGRSDWKDSNDHPMRQHVPKTERATVATQTETAGIPSVFKDPMTERPVGRLPSQYIILHFGRCPRLFCRVLQCSRLGQNLRSQQAEITPSWANGAKILAPGLGPDDLQHNGHDPATLRPWHVVARVEDVPEIFRSLQSMPYHQRPRAKSSMARRGFLKRSDGSRIHQLEGFGDSFVDGELHGKNTWAEPLRVVPSLAMGLPTLRMFDSLEQDEVSSQKKGRAGSPQEGFEHAASEPAAAIDKETADAISKAIATSFLEEHPCVQCGVVGTGAMAMQVQNTFLHAPEELSCSHSPRTLVTV